MDSSVFLDVLDIGYFNAKLLWILADMGDGVGSVSLCSGFVKKIMNSINLSILANLNAP
ncbi:hypothetical protein [Helicobacter pylori]|uniref:hypothetical protein n=1 Tax=Helicobacter pylori TaxID=210 RepID=UPI00167FE67D|nr:hypothetical protein [Helicobacter pylori]